MIFSAFFFDTIASDGLIDTKITVVIQVKEMNESENIEKKKQQTNNRINALSKYLHGTLNSIP